jgi:hypothetical protein
VDIEVSEEQEIDDSSWNVIEEYLGKFFIPVSSPNF